MGLADVLVDKQCVGGNVINLGPAKQQSFTADQAPRRMADRLGSIAIEYIRSR
jgi:hypothetical protein